LKLFKREVKGVNTLSSQGPIRNDFKSKYRKYSRISRKICDKIRI